MREEENQVKDFVCIRRSASLTFEGWDMVDRRLAPMNLVDCELFDLYLYEERPVLLWLRIPCCLESDAEVSL